MVKRTCNHFSSRERIFFTSVGHWVWVTLQWPVSQSVCLGIEPLWRSWPDFSFW